MTDTMQTQANRDRWEYVLLRAFDLPDIIAPDHVHSAIAHSIVAATSNRSSKQSSAPLDAAEKIVEAVVQTGATGELDTLFVDLSSPQGKVAPHEAILRTAGLSTESQPYVDYTLNRVASFARSNPQLPGYLARQQQRM